MVRASVRPRAYVAGGVLSGLVTPDTLGGVDNDTPSQGCVAARPELA